MAWLKRIASCVCLVLLAAIVMYWLWLPSTDVRRCESYAAMSDFLRSGLIGEAHSLGFDRGLVVIYGSTSNGMYRTLPVSWSGFGSWPVRVEATIRTLFPERLERRFDLPNQYILSRDLSIAPTDLTEEQRRISYGTITFSKVILNHDATRAVFYTEHLCPLCGEGKFVAMEKRGNQWVVVDEKSVWVS